MSRTETSLLFSLQELRDLEGERAQRERAALAAEEQRREKERQQELAQQRAKEDERQRLQDALQAALVERDTQTALARRAVERHATLATELAEAQLALANSEQHRRQALANAPTPAPPSRSLAWTIANGLLAIGSLSLLTATIVFRHAPPDSPRTIPIPVPVAVEAPATPAKASASSPSPPTPSIEPTRNPTKPTTRPRPKAASALSTSGCDGKDPICGLGLD